MFIPENKPSGIDFEPLITSIGTTLIEKNRKYGDSALNPKQIMYRGNSTASITIRLDDKISRVLNSKKTETGYQINKNDIFDIIGYLTLFTIGEQRVIMASMSTGFHVSFQLEVQAALSSLIEYHATRSRFLILMEDMALKKDTLTEDPTNAIMEAFTERCADIQKQAVVDANTMYDFCKACIYIAIILGFGNFEDQID